LEGSSILATGISEDDSRAEIVGIVRRAGSSFYWAMRLLPERKREAMFAVYAFCREVDDIADGPMAPEDKRHGLDDWQLEIDALYRGEPRQMVTRALIGPVREYGLAKEDFEAVIAGMRMDAVNRLRLADETELALYCDRVACAVGRLSTPIFGLDATNGRALAKALGDALQLTNILRDVQEDAERDHVYLPTDLLARHGIHSTELADILAHPGLAGACLELAGRAESRFAETETIMARCDRRAARPALIMKTVYEDILISLKARGWRDIATPVHQSKLRKTGLIAKSLLLS
jgi:squalene synthase HpnD